MITEFIGAFPQQYQSNYLARFRCGE